MEFHVLPGPAYSSSPSPTPTFATFAKIDSANNSAKLSEGVKNNKDFHKIFPTHFGNRNFVLERKGRKQGGSERRERVIWNKERVTKVRGGGRTD
jgi:hypothetical protein